MPKLANEEIQQSFNKGLKILMNAFSAQTKEYSKTIYEQEIEIKRLKEENNIYKNKLSLLHKKLCMMSKTFCDINMENEETKIQSEENQVIHKELMTVNNMYPQKIKKDSFTNHKASLEKNLKFSSFQEKPKSSRLQNKMQKKNSSNHHYNNLKYLLNNNNRDYNRLIGNLNYLKKKSINVDNNGDELNNTHNHKNTNSYFTAVRKENDKKNENFKTEREYRNKKIFSDNFIEDNEMNIEIPDLFSNNTISFNDNNMNDNIKNNDNFKSKNDSDIEPKNKKYEDNLKAKALMEDESKEQSGSSTYQKLNLFLEKCKVKLNALDYEKIINVLKFYENNVNIDIIKKIKKIINSNIKLCELFDDIFETS